MKCHKHFESDAVSQCLDCGKGLCLECTNKFTIPICSSCNLTRLKNNKNILVKNSIITIVAFVIGLYIYSGMEEATLPFTLLGALFIAGIPWGWSFLNKITPNVFLIMPVVGWLVYFGIKFTLALFIGIFIMPFKIYQIVKGLKELNTLESYIKA